MLSGMGKPGLSENVAHVSFSFPLPTHFSPFSFLPTHFSPSPHLLFFFFFSLFYCCVLLSSWVSSHSIPKRQALVLHELWHWIGWILHCWVSAQCDLIFLCKNSLKNSASHLSFWFFFPSCMVSRTAQGEWRCYWCVLNECLWRPFCIPRRLGGSDMLQRLPQGMISRAAWGRMALQVVGIGWVFKETLLLSQENDRLWSNAVAWVLGNIRCSWRIYPCLRPNKWLLAFDL